MARITKMISDQTGDSMFFVTEDGKSINAIVIASDNGYTIAQYDAGDRWVAIQVEDYGDGNAEYFDHYREGDSFTYDTGEEFVVRRTDDAGSLKWVLKDS